MLLFLTSLDDPVLAENFARATQLLASRHLVMAGMLRPPSAQPLFHDPNVNVPGDIYRQLAGHISWKRLRELESTLGRRGVVLVRTSDDGSVDSPGSRIAIGVHALKRARRRS